MRQTSSRGTAASGRWRLEALAATKGSAPGTEKKMRECPRAKERGLLFPAPHSPELRGGHPDAAAGPFCSASLHGGPQGSSRQTVLCWGLCRALEGVCSTLGLLFLASPVDSLFTIFRPSRSQLLLAWTPHPVTRSWPPAVCQDQHQCLDIRNRLLSAPPPQSLSLLSKIPYQWLLACVRPEIHTLPCPRTEQTSTLTSPYC